MIAVNPGFIGYRAHNITGFYAVIMADFNAVGFHFNICSAERTFRFAVFLRPVGS